MLQRIKNAIPKQWKIYLNSLRFRKNNPYKKLKGKKKVIITLAADYGNLGDVAITYAQILFIKKHFPKYHVVTFPTQDTYRRLRLLKLSCGPDDIITIVGGGNMGDKYEGFEESRRTIIKYFPDNIIVSFPQTIDFSHTHQGKKSLKKSIDVYSRHKNLFLFARESASYSSMKKCFPNNNVQCVPDIVLSMKKALPIMKRENIVICFRNDIESKISLNEKENLVELLKRTYGKIQFYDTHIGDDRFEHSSAEVELNHIWTAFKQAKVVITDRLHGMIFCAITKTPCIVFPNKNHKVLGCYENWLKNLEYISLIHKMDIAMVMDKVKKYIRTDPESYKGVELEEAFQPLISVLKK